MAGPSLFLSSNILLIVAILFSLSIAQAAPTAKQPISPELFNKFVRYTTFSAAAYSTNCQKPPFGSKVVEYFDNKGTDTQGYIFQDDAAKELIVAFPGTASTADFQRDLNQTLAPYVSEGVNCPGGCTVHQGYLAAWNSVSGDVLKQLKTAMATNPTYAVTVTGHSLGGGMAAFASGSIAGSGMANITTYTFGEPRNGNQAFANYMDQLLPVGKMFRVTHANDGVPQVVTQADGFMHHATEYWESGDTNNDATTTFMCPGQDVPDCNASIRGTGIGPGLVGINSAHIQYSNMGIGNPLSPDAACQ